MSLISKDYTFSAGQVIVASEHNSNFDTIYNDYNGNITNANLSNSAAVAYSKLNLSNSITNSDINSAAAIVYSKLNLTGTIVNADVSASADIVDTKLAQITTASKVHGTSITGLASLPSGAGVIPVANLGTSPTATTFLRGDGTFAGAGSYKLTSTTSVSAASKSSAISVTNTKHYLIVVDITTASTSGTYYGIEFNGDTANNVYYVYAGNSLTAAISRANGNASFCYLTNSSSSPNASGTRFGSIINLFPQSTGTTKRVYISGKSTYINNVNEIEYLDFAAQYANGTTDLASFKIIIGSGNFTGTIYLYELVTS